ncbi:flagellar basal body rod protein FlgC [Pseudomethylobacillus aquaticus]|uniref:Flagellar basal-body rod protein FlgC n=1 Tax=Pseudomethylobacillus aquaticus TaxID=2676064 RepID=A0A3N0UZE6_9PROT|nr:flagellar basal body rod protein FlgC [Pseudomethylobacillus aquaticus]ROH85900.1 flagellar basal body rod protein FlgC [Pseudomethylobacillus aquaticus]
MDFSYVSAISLAGMDVERARLDVAAINLANVHTTRAAYGGPFKPLKAFGVSTQKFSPAYSAIERSMMSVPDVRIQQSTVLPRFVQEPGHPDANEKGYVAYPGIDTVAEMVNMMTAVRSYEANVVAMNAAKAMAMKALEIGGV